MVCGRAHGHSLVTDPRVALVSFTGGSETAAKISAAAGPRKMLMELGGNNPTIVCPDAVLRDAVAGVVAGAFGVAGQNCLSVQRVYVHSSLSDEFVRDTVARTRRLAVGSKHRRGTDIGPLVNESATRRVEKWVGHAVADGAVLHTGGVRHAGPSTNPRSSLTSPPAPRCSRRRCSGPW